MCGHAIHMVAYDGTSGILISQNSSSANDQEGECRHESHTPWEIPVHLHMVMSQRVNTACEYGTIIHYISLARKPTSCSFLSNFQALFSY